VDIRGTLYSHPNQPDDVELKVEYTLGGVTVEDTVDLTVIVPCFTTSQADPPDQAKEWFGKWVRWYYHRLVDQYNYYINVSGIPVHEDINFVEGDKGFGAITGDGQTHNYGRFGISAKDTCSCRIRPAYSKWRQNLTAGGWNTTPNYYIYFDIIESHGDEKIWKEPF